MKDGAIRSYRDLKVWQEAVALAVTCYRLTGPFPRAEMFGLSAQIRRASVSVAANIAEGHGREHTRSFIQHLRIAQGSLKELETHWIIAEKVRLIDAAGAEEVLNHCGSVGRLMRSLIRSLERKVQGE